MNDDGPKYYPGIGWRNDTEHSMLRRMHEHDYQSRCIYMLTITLADRSHPILGTLTKDSNGDATVNATDLGKHVIQEWHNLSHDYPQVEIIRLQVMPEHLHVVLFVKDTLPKPLGKLVGIVKNRSNKHYWKMLTDKGLLAPKGQQKPPSLFSDGFQDTILFGAGHLEKMIKYVEDNPRRAMIKHDNPSLFSVVSEQKIGDTTFAAIGNRWLLDRAIRLQVRCHNNTTSQNLYLIEQQKKYFLECGKKGGVVVSPCISAGEKEIARAALEAKQPLIVVLENGFPPMYKPPGRLFDACAEGLLLMLAPWPYHMEKRTITRDQCLQLNAMAAAISNVPWTEELEQALLKAGEGAG